MEVFSDVNKLLGAVALFIIRPNAVFSGCLLDTSTRTLLPSLSFLRSSIVMLWPTSSIKLRLSEPKSKLSISR